MNVLALTKGDERVASSRVRVWQLFRFLKKEHIAATILHSMTYPAWSVSQKRFGVVRSVIHELHKKPDVVFFHKSLFPWDVVLLVVLWCRIKKIPYVYDCDDAEWIHSPRKTRTLIRGASVVFAGSHAIQQYAKKLNARVELIPSVVDHSLYGGASHDSHPPVIVWVGYGPAHLRSGNFDVLRDALRLLSEKGIPFQFVLVGGNHDKALHAYWGNETYALRIIDEADWKNPNADAEIFREIHPAIGVMPLTDSPFVRAKCAYKAIEYMAAGIPVIASPVGEAIPLLEQSGAGVHARTREEWMGALRQLLSDGDGRLRMGKAGEKEVREKYSYEAIVPRVYAALQYVQCRNSR